MPSCNWITNATILVDMGDTLGGGHGLAKALSYACLIVVDVWSQYCNLSMNSHSRKEEWIMKFKLQQLVILFIHSPTNASFSQSKSVCHNNSVRRQAMLLNVMYNVGKKQARKLSPQVWFWEVFCIILNFTQLAVDFKIWRSRIYEDISLKGINVEYFTLIIELLRGMQPLLEVVRL